METTIKSKFSIKLDSFEKWLALQKKATESYKIFKQHEEYCKQFNKKD